MKRLLNPRCRNPDYPDWRCPDQGPERLPSRRCQRFHCLTSRFRSRSADGYSRLASSGRRNHWQSQSRLPSRFPAPPENRCSRFRNRSPDRSPARCRSLMRTAGRSLNCSLYCCPPGAKRSVRRTGRGFPAPGRLRCFLRLYCLRFRNRLRLCRFPPNRSKPGRLTDGRHGSHSCAQSRSPP